MAYSSAHRPRKTELRPSKGMFQERRYKPEAVLRASASSPSCRSLPSAASQRIAVSASGYLGLFLYRDMDEERSVHQSGRSLWAFAFLGVSRKVPEAARPSPGRRGGCRLSSSAATRASQTSAPGTSPASGGKRLSPRNAECNETGTAGRTRLASATPATRTAPDVSRSWSATDCLLLGSRRRVAPGSLRARSTSPHRPG